MILQKKNDILIILIITIILLIIIELTLTLIYFLNNKSFRYNDNYNEEVTFVTNHLSKHYIPNSKIKFRDILYDTNSDGLVDTLGEIESVSKIAIIGGSTVEGRGSSNNENTIASHIYSCLKNKGLNYQVLNFGRVGLYSYTSYRLLAEKFLAQFKPNLLIQLNGRNDFHFNLINSDEKFELQSDINNLQEIMEFNMKGNSLKGAIKEIFSSTHSYYYSYKLLEKFKHYQNRIKQKYLNIYKKESFIHEELLNLNNERSQLRALRGVKIFNANIESTRNLSEALDIQYLHFLQPTLFYKKNLTEEERSYAQSWFERNQLGIQYKQELIKHYKLAKQLLNKNTIDISDLFEFEKNTLYVDSVHYNDIGNKKIADKICSYINN